MVDDRFCVNCLGKFQENEKSYDAHDYGVLDNGKLVEKQKYVLCVGCTQTVDVIDVGVDYE